MSNLFDQGFFGLSGYDADAEFIPLITAEEEEHMNKQEFPEELPILPLRNNVLFPGVVIPITVGRDKSIKLIQEANKGNKIIGVVSQKNQDVETPQFEDLHQVGTVAQIIRMLKMPDGSSTVIIQGKRRFEMVQPTQTEPYMKAKVRVLTEQPLDAANKELEVMFSTIKDLALQIIRESPNIPSEAQFAIGNIDSPSFLVNFISSNMNADVAKKQSMLEEMDMKKRVMLVLEHLTAEIQVLEMRNEIQNKVRKDLDKQQREYFLHQQMRTKYDNNDVAGVVTGLAWTAAGGDILFIESLISKGNGKLTLTGNLGEVMKESAVIALEYLKSHHEQLGLDPDIFAHYNVHIHVPEGATPKDGPSAGVTMLTALASLFTQRKVKKNLAMTGEITLRGDVLPVGGIKEKILAAKRAGITDLILCSKNKQDVDEIAAVYLKGLHIQYVDKMAEVLKLGLLKDLVSEPKKLVIPEKKTNK